MSNKVRNLIWLLFVLFTIPIVSCTVPTIDAPAADASLSSLSEDQRQGFERAEDMINPGDTIGGMVVTEAGAWDWDTNLYSRCEEHGERLEDRAEEGKVVTETTCQLEPGTEILLNCSGVYADPALGEDLDTNWSKLKTRMLIDDQEVNLNAFGWIDFQSQLSERLLVRTLDVKLENLTPGMHTVFCAEEYPGEDSHENTYHFDVQTLTYPALPA